MERFFRIRPKQFRIKLDIDMHGKSNVNEENTNIYKCYTFTQKSNSFLENKLSTVPQKCLYSSLHTKNFEQLPCLLCEFVILYESYRTCNLKIYYRKYSLFRSLPSLWSCTMKRYWIFSTPPHLKVKHGTYTYPLQYLLTYEVSI